MFLILNADHLFLVVDQLSVVLICVLSLYMYVCWHNTLVCM